MRGRLLWSLLPPLGLMLATFALLMMQFPSRGLWYDETVNAYFAQQSWANIWEWCTRIDNQVPLHFALLKLWVDLAGASEFALRMFSVACGVLATAGIITMGRHVGGSWRAGLLAALAFVLSQSFMYAAYEVRPYALALALGAWSSASLWRGWRLLAMDMPTDAPGSAQGARPWLALYLLLALALLYTHYTGFLLIGAQGVFVGISLLVDWRQPREARRLRWAAALAAGLAIGFLPWMVALAGRDVTAGTAYDDRVAPDDALNAYLDFYAHGQRVVPDDPPYSAAILAVIAAAVGFSLLHGWRVRAARPGLGLTLAILFVPLLGLLIMVWSVQAKLSGRHAWAVWIGAALVIGLGLAALWPRLKIAALPIWGALLLVIALPAQTDAPPTYNSYLREAFAYIRANAQPGDVLVLRDGTLFTAAGYYDVPVPWIGLPDVQLTNVDRFLFAPEALHGLGMLVAEHDARRVWVLSWQGDIMDPQHLVDGLLEYSGQEQPLGGSTGYGDVHLSLYTLDAPPDIALYALAERIDALSPLAYTPGDGPVFLGGYRLEDGPVPHGGAVRVHTWWMRGAVVQPGMRISVRLYDRDSNFYAQQDQPPVASYFGQENWRPGQPVLSRHTLIVPPDMPPGPAEVRLIIYDIAGGFAPREVPVAEFAVVP